jgi:hypothetical protein
MLWVLNKLHVNVKGDSCWCELIDQSINQLFGKQFHVNAKGYLCCGLSELINHLCQKIVVVGDISSHLVGLMMIDVVQ